MLDEKVDHQHPLGRLLNLRSDDPIVAEFDQRFLTLTEEEEERLKKPIQIEYTDDEGKLKSLKLTFKRFTDGRRKAPKGKDEEYEVLWTSDLKTWVSKEKLVKAGFEKLLKDKGAKRLPNPPIELPDWLEDTRN